MKITTCTHREKIEPGNGFKIGTCSICGQVRQYNTQNRKEKPLLVKLGRINGMIVLPTDRDSLSISNQEATELAAAKSFPEKQEAGAIHQDVTTAEEKQAAAQVVPPRPKRRKALEKYFEDNKEAILEDYYGLTLKKFYAKWHISTAQWARLKKSWGASGKPRGGLRPMKESIPPPAPEHGAAQLPPFPPFNNNWISSVQLEWLSTYKALKELEAAKQ